MTATKQPTDKEVINSILSSGCRHRIKIGDHWRIRVPKPFEAARFPIWDLAAEREAMRDDIVDVIITPELMQKLVDRTT